MKLLLSFLITGILFFSSCSNNEKAGNEPDQIQGNELLSTGGTPEYAPENKNSPESKEQNLPIERKIIKTANISMEVSDIKEARIALNNLLIKYDAYVSDEKLSDWGNRLNDELTIRVKAEHFDSLLNHVSKLAVHVVSKHVSLSDVTEEYIDVRTRLENKKKVEQQYLELLKKAKSIDEILQINEHLRRIREEIEAKEGRLKYLSNQVSLSTVYLTMYQNISSKDYPGFGNKMLKAFKGGWEGIQVFVLALIYLWPFIIIVLLVVWFIMRRRKKKQKV